MDQIKTDICVIGAGSGGLSVASGAVQMGASVVLIEGGKMGGDCLNYGCVPSKALLAAGKAAAAHRAGAALGVEPDEPVIDYAAAKDHVAAVVGVIEPHDSQERFEGLGVQVIRDYARFVSPSEVEAGGKRITARRFVVATGSSPFVPPIPGLDAVPYLTNEDIFDLRDAPGHLLIVGGGPIGLEMAQAHRRLGCKVTVVEGGESDGRRRSRGRSRRDCGPAGRGCRDCRRRAGRACARPPRRDRGASGGRHRVCGHASADGGGAQAECRPFEPRCRRDQTRAPRD